MRNRKFLTLSLLSLLTFVALPAFAQKTQNPIENHPTKDDGSVFFLSDTQASLPAQHTSHFQQFGSSVPGYNQMVLKGIDKVQATAPKGGGYFIGIKAKPTESPIGYDIELFGRQLLDAPRTTSYCSGSSYSAFVEGLNIFYEKQINKKTYFPKLSRSRYEAFRMQELDGSRRNDGVKMWGKWNDDGFGNHFALVQYTGMGEVVKPDNARPGDFINISWKSGYGHSTIFLGYYKNPKLKAEGKPYKFIRYWSSQRGTDGLGDQMSPLSKIENVMVVRLTHPERLFTFNINKKVKRKIPGYPIKWAQSK